MVEVQKLKVSAISDLPAQHSAEIGIDGVGVQKLEFFEFLRRAQKPSADIVRVDTLSLWSRANLFKPRRTKLSRGLRACFRNRAVAGSISPWSAAAPAQAKKP